MTTVYVYLCSCLLRLYAVGFVQTAVQVFVGQASFERTYQRSICMDDLGHVLSLVLGYRESSVVGTVYDRYLQRFLQCPIKQKYGHYHTNTQSIPFIEFSKTKNHMMIYIEITQ